MVTVKVWSAKVWATRRPNRYRTKDERPTLPKWFYAPIVDGIVRLSESKGPFDSEAKARAAAEGGTT